MKKRARELIKELIPPAFIKLSRKMFFSRGIHFKGPFTSWEKATLESGGYDQEIILQLVRQSALLVKQGKAAYERDAAVFHEFIFDWPILSVIMWSAAKEKGSLRVLDFGGSLGSTFFQNLPFLKHLADIKWGIVEQPDFVKHGQSEFQESRLLFFNDIDSCKKAIHPDIVLLGSVLQYLPDPYLILEQLLNSGASTFIVDRTYVHQKAIDQVFVQVNPSTIYPANYPCWLLSEAKLVDFFEKHSVFPVVDHVNSEFPALEGQNASLKCFIFSRLPFNSRQA